MVTVSNWDKSKTSEITSKSGTPTVSNGIALPFIIEGGSTDSTGTGRCNIDTSDATISSKDDLVLVNLSDNSDLNYYFERFDTANQVYSGWVFFSNLDRDGSTQFKILFGNGPSGGNAESARTTVFSGVTGLVHRPYLGTSGGTVPDDSGNGYDSIGESGITYEHTASDFIGKAVRLQSSNNDYINYGTGYSKIVPSHFNNTQDLMILTHQKRTSDGSGSARIYQNDGQDSGEPWMSLNNGAHSFEGATGNNYDQDVSEAVAGIARGSNAYIYEDGSETGTSTDATYRTTDQDTVIGGNIEKSVNFYDGYVDEVQVFDTERSFDFVIAWQEATPGGGEQLYDWNSAETTSTLVTATPALGQGTPLTAQTTSILGNWRGQDDGRITERTQTKVQGEYAQKWQLYADKTTAEKATFVADETMQPDLSKALGTISGSFTQGTFGLHMQIDDTTVLRDTDTLQLKIGSSPNDYAVWTLDRSELGPDGEFTYYTFSHSDYDSITGTPDWTSADFYELTLFETSGNTTDTFIYVDYLTVSDRDDVGATGIGDRRSDKEQIRSGD